MAQTTTAAPEVPGTETDPAPNAGEPHGDSEVGEKAEVKKEPFLLLV